MANINDDDPASRSGELAISETERRKDDFNNGSQSDDTNSTGDSIEPAVDTNVSNIIINQNEIQVQKAGYYERVELEPGHVEERFRVDRKKLELMLQIQISPGKTQLLII